MQTSRDLLLLAAVAFQNKQYDDAGALFASSMSAADAPEFLNLLNEGSTDFTANPESTSSESNEEGTMSLSQIAKALSNSMSISSSEEDDEDGDDEDGDERIDPDGEEGADEDDDTDSDDIDPEVGGTTILPSSISTAIESTSTGVVKPSVRRKSSPDAASTFVLAAGVKSPIKLKA